MRQKRLIALALVVLGGMLVFVILSKPPALPAVMILPPTPLAVKSGRVPDRWIPAKWTRLQRACRYFLGDPKQVGFNVRYMETSETVESIISRNSLGPPQARGNGLAVWILPDGTLRPPKGDTTVLGAARILTAARERAKLSVTHKAGNYSAEVFPILEDETVDFLTRLIVTSAGKTNFVAAARAQLPYGQALFVLDVRQPEVDDYRMGFLITADEYDAKGNKVHAKAGGR
jgi:hypothetical protein